MFRNRVRAVIFPLWPLAAGILIKLFADNIYILVIGIAASLILVIATYYAIMEWLLPLRWFRRLLFSKVVRWEGEYATDLSPPGKVGHPHYRYSYAEIRYNPEKDALEYSGVAFSPEGDRRGDWKSGSFVFDQPNNIFLFSSFGVGPGKPSAQQTALGSRVKSCGMLEPEDDDSLFGTVIDLGDQRERRQRAQVQSLIFDMRLHRIIPADKNRALGKNKRPNGDSEKAKLVRTTLSRVERFSGAV